MISDHLCRLCVFEVSSNTLEQTSLSHRNNLTFMLLLLASTTLLPLLVCSKSLEHTSHVNT